MSELLKELRALPDEEIIRRHDNLAGNTAPGVNHYLREIARRDQAKQTKTTLVLTKWITIMTAAIMLFTVANVVVALLLITN